MPIIVILRNVHQFLSVVLFIETVSYLMTSTAARRATQFGQTFDFGVHRVQSADTLHVCVYKRIPAIPYGACLVLTGDLYWRDRCPGSLTVLCAGRLWFRDPGNCVALPARLVCCLRCPEVRIIWPGAMPGMRSRSQISVYFAIAFHLWWYFSHMWNRYVFCRGIITRN